MVPPGELALRREARLQVLEELIEALGRLEKARLAATLSLCEPNSCEYQEERQHDEHDRRDQPSPHGAGAGVQVSDHPAEP